VRAPGIKKGSLNSENPFENMVPERGIEPPTFSLRVSCSTD
jgi:hypothetical protein